ncbi:hypothetical protein IVP19_12095 [Enterococcus faecium]|nr:hypothetical protein [Enterococcus faecium]
MTVLFTFTQLYGLYLYGGIVLISLLSSTLYSLNIIDVSTSNSISIIGIIIAAIITQLFLVFGEKKRSKK